MSLKVAAQQGGAENIRISSDCDLSFGQSYSVCCEPEGFTIQPEVSRVAASLVRVIN